MRGPVNVPAWARLLQAVMGNWDIAQIIQDKDPLHAQPEVDPASMRGIAIWTGQPLKATSTSPAHRQPSHNRPIDYRV